MDLHLIGVQPGVAGQFDDDVSGSDGNYQNQFDIEVGSLVLMIQQSNELVR